jgi:hypothetical protein
MATTLRDDRWYAVRTKPGSQRMARAIDGLPEHRAGESIIERNLRTKGMDVFMPSWWHTTRHHRTNKLIERRLPFLVGYAFVHLPNLDFEKVRKVDGVMCFLQTNRDSGPLRFKEQDLAVMMLAEWEEEQKRRFRQAELQEIGRFNRRNKLHGELRRILPKGRAIRINMREQAEKVIHSMPDVVKTRVLGIIKELDALEADEPLALIDAVA